MSYTVLHFIQHAQSLNTVSGDVTILDPGLTHTGIQECHNFPMLDLSPDTLILCSTAKRALETASLLFGTTSHKIYATDLLLEYNTGVECNKRHSLYTKIENYPSIDFHAFLMPPLPEEKEWDDGDRRAQQLKTLLKGLNRSTVVLVSHANIFRNIEYTLTGVYNKEEIPNATCKSLKVTL